MPASVLANLIRERAQRLRDSVDSLPIGELCDDAELLLVLARVVEGQHITRALGPVGDWGYNTPIGKALIDFRTKGGK